MNYQASLFHWGVRNPTHYTVFEVEGHKEGEEERQSRPERYAQMNVTSLPSAVHRVVVLGATVEMVVPS